MAGLVLDPWQEIILAGALGERPDGRWSASAVGVCVPRQNGKGGVIEARELAGLFLLGEPLITHSAHQFDTSLEAFRRLLGLIEGTPEFSRRVRRVSRSHGEEGIELKGGQRIRYRTRTRGGGRGFTGQTIIFDEAMYLSEATMGALLPTLSAMPNPQVWYTGSAVDQEVHDHGRVFARTRERGLRGGDPSLAWFEWSAEGLLSDAEALASSPRAWAEANPALGIRIDPEFIERVELPDLTARTFAVERLGIGDWPDEDEGANFVIDLETWRALIDPASGIHGAVSLAVDVTPDRSAASIAAAGRRPDGQFHVEVIEHGAGSGWLPDRVGELISQHQIEGPIRFDENGPAAALLPDFRDRDIKTEAVGGREMARACGAFHAGVVDRRVHHLGTRELHSALRGARPRSLGDAWAWSRRSSSVDISPLVAATLALWGVSSQAVAGRVAALIYPSSEQR